MARIDGEFAAFLSYAHFGDEYEDERIAEFRRKLQTELRVQTGYEIPIFYDRENILVGQQWKERIRSSLDGTTLLIVILTPLFFSSSACRAEVVHFLDREKRLGREDLIIPVRYIATPELLKSDDEIVITLKERQYFDATDLRFEDLDSPKSRQAIARLASQVITALERQPHELNVEDTAQPSLQDTVDDSPGFLELLAAAEEAMPQLQGTMESFTVELENFGDQTRTATDEMDQASTSSKPSAVKLAITHKLKVRLEEPVSQMERLAAEYNDQLTVISAGVDALIGRVAEANDEEIDAATELLDVFDGLKTASSESFDSLSGLRETLARNYSLSAALRPTLRRMSNALQSMLPSRDEFARWHSDLQDALSSRD